MTDQEQLQELNHDLFSVRMERDSLLRRVEELESRIEVLGTTIDQEVVVSQRYKQALEEIEKENSLYFMKKIARRALEGKS